jgi:hypothetical protein
MKKIFVIIIFEENILRNIKTEINSDSESEQKEIADGFYEAIEMNL